MLTVCIPVYNYDCRKLIIELDKQAAELEIPIEILLIDDGSEKEYNDLYLSIAAGRIRLVTLPANRGRSAVRNLFEKEAAYDHLLFLDCDDKIIHSDFLRKYRDIIHSNDGVLCGGIVYQGEEPEQRKMLHWKYEKKNEQLLHSRRKSNPYQAFISNNFLIRKEDMVAVGFNETLRQYGHEDTLFGFDLFSKGIKITYIENPVLHADLNENSVFLKKTELAIENLVEILRIKSEKEFIQSVSLLKHFFRLQRVGVITLLVPFQDKIIGYCFQKLLPGTSSLLYLKVYKLCLLSKYYQKRKF